MSNEIAPSTDPERTHSSHSGPPSRVDRWWPRDSTWSQGHWAEIQPTPCSPDPSPRTELFPPAGRASFRILTYVPEGEQGHHLSVLSSFCSALPIVSQFCDDFVGLNWCEIQLKIFLKIIHTDCLSIHPLIHTSREFNRSLD